MVFGKASISKTSASRVIGFYTSHRGWTGWISDCIYTQGRASRYVRLDFNFFSVQNKEVHAAMHLYHHPKKTGTGIFGFFFGCRKLFLVLFFWDYKRHKAAFLEDTPDIVTRLVSSTPGYAFASSNFFTSLGLWLRDTNGWTT